MGHRLVSLHCFAPNKTNTLSPPSQIHLICALRLGPPLHPGRGPAAHGPEPRALRADHHGPATQYLAPLQDTAGVPASPSAAAIQEHHHRLPQENQRRLHHGAELRLPPTIQTFPLQCGAGGDRPKRATSVREGGAGGWGHTSGYSQGPYTVAPPKAGCH